MSFNYHADTKSYDYTPKDNPKDRVQVEIGDAEDSSKFFPQVKIKRWDNECNLSYRLNDINIPGNVTVTDDGEKITWIKKQGQNKWKAIFYHVPEGEGGFEFEVVLPAKPPQNYLEFTLVDNDVEYFYQPPLTEEIKIGDRDGLVVSVTETDAFDKDGKSVIHRPENVVGSYAVYTSENKINYVGGKEYKCGQIGMIYRPKIIDSAGTEVWGDLHIENGILSVTIPQEFLDKAVYPVRHAAGLTLGYTTVGESGGAMGTYVVASGKSQASASGDLSNIKVACADAGANSSVKMCVYNDSSGEPGSLITGSSCTALVTRTTMPTQESEWTSANVTGSIALSSYYWPAFHTEDGTVIIYATTGQPNGTSKYKSQSYADFPTDPAPSSMSNYTSKYSIYATYTASGLSISDGSAPGDTASLSLTTWTRNISVQDSSSPNDSVNEYINPISISVTDTSAPGDSASISKISPPINITTGDGVGYGNGYSYRRSVVIDNTKVSGTGDLTDFPMLIKGTYDGTGGIADLRHTTHSGKVTDLNGYDIIFTSDSAGNTKLDHEIISYVHDTGEIVMWVRIPTLDGDADTTIYMLYGNSGVTTSQENVSGLWTDDYKAVWHLKDLNDSSGNSNTWTNGGADQGVAGKINTGYDFVAANVDYMDCTENGSLDITGTFSMSTWVKFDSVASLPNIFYKAPIQGWGSAATKTWDFGYIAGGAVIGIAKDASNYLSKRYTFTPGTTWHYLVATWTGSPGGANLDMYVDGVVSTESAVEEVGSVTSMLTNDDTARFGGKTKPGGTSYLLDGIIEEFRINNTCHTEEWIATEYANQNDPSTFYSMGNESIGIGDSVTIQLVTGGPSYLDISVADGSTSNDSVNNKINPLIISLTDSTAPGDSVSLSLTTWSRSIAVTDGTVPGDSLLIYLNKLFILVSDGTAPGDAVTLSSNELSESITVQDGTYPGDSVALTFTTYSLGITVSDNTIATDILPPWYDDAVVAGDTSQVDVSVLFLNILISVLDSSTPNDSLLLKLLPLVIQVIEGTVPGDTATLTKTDWSRNIFITDGSSPGDSLAIYLNALFILISDGTVPGDVTSASLTTWSRNISASDGTATGEIVVFNLQPLNIKITDGTEPGDSKIAYLEGGAAPFNINVTDGTAPGDSLVLNIRPLNVQIAEWTEPADVFRLLLNKLVIVAQDGLNSADSSEVALVGAREPLAISVIDSSTPGDSAEIQLPYLAINVEDGSEPGEVVSVKSTNLYISVTDGTIARDVVTVTKTGISAIYIRCVDGVGGPPKIIFVDGWPCLHLFGNYYTHL